MKLKKMITGCCAFVALALVSSQAWAISLSFDLASSSVSVGDSFDVDITISGLEFDDLSSFNFDVSYDSTVLAFDSYVLGPELTDSFWGQDDWSFGDDGMGTVNLSEFSWLWDLSFQPDSFTLATVSFTGSAAGLSMLTLSNVILGDAWGAPLQADLYSGSVDVNAPVPEPGTILLFATGIVGLAGHRLRRKKIGYF